MASPGDKPMLLRGPSLPGSLGVDLRGDWETFEEENHGIDMRCGGEDDPNVQLDLMKGLDRHDTRERDLDETGRKCLPSLRNESVNEAEGRDCIAGHHELIESAENRSLISGTSEDTINSSLMLSHDPNVDLSASGGIALANGKQYHVFFSYEMADRDWVHSTVDKMESVGYKCSFHERDFHGGKRVIENIMEHIQLSMKTVLVLSPDFLQSSWCQFEMKQGLHASIEEARMLLVPVMVRECTVPDTLRSLTYIDATTGTDWWGRFEEAVLSEDNLQICNDDRNQIAIQPKFDNLDVLCEVSSTFQLYKGELLDIPYTPEVFNKPGTQVPNEEFHAAVSPLKSAVKTFSLNTCFCNNKPICGTLYFICMVTMFASIGYGCSEFFLNTVSSDEERYRNGCLAIILPVLFMVIYAVLFFYQENKLKKNIMKSAVKVNQRLLQYKILTGVKTFKIGHPSSPRSTVTFWYYDVRQCRVHLQEFLDALNDIKIESVSCEKYSESLIFAFTENYTQDYQEGRLKYHPDFIPRHVRHVKCLCQYIEDLVEKQENKQKFLEKKLNLAPQEIV